jgi:hypothetical protein
MGHVDWPVTRRVAGFQVILIGRFWVIAEASSTSQAPFTKTGRDER